MSSLGLLLALLLAPACGGSVASGSSGAGGHGSTGAGGSSSTSGAGGGAPDGGPAVACTANPPVFPTFDKGCDIPAACAIKFHMVSCCGTQVAIGISVSQSAAFDQAEAACEAMYPGCGCAQGPTTAEDGKQTADNSMIKVDCKAGTCLTYIP